MTVRVRLLGRPRIDAVPPGRQPRGRKSWAVLARVALAERGVLRRELAEELFASADDPLAAQRWCLADLRGSLHEPGLLHGDPLTIGAGAVWIDAHELAAGSLPDADLGGTLLDGIELRDAPGFTAWLLTARARSAALTTAELRERALRLLAAGETSAAVDLAARGARLEPLDEPAQELFLRALVADAQPGLARAQLAACEGMFAREGLPVSPALRSAVEGHRGPRPARVHAGVVARSLLQAGSAALDAGAADGGIETLRRAADDAVRADDPGLQAEVFRALGGALVHAVRGQDGEGALVLHRALRAARAADQPALVAEIQRELAFVDVQAGRHASARRAVDEAGKLAVGLRDPALTAGILAIAGMNTADQGRHLAAAALLRSSVTEAERGARPRQQAWSLGVLARSLLLSGHADAAQRAADESIALVRQQRWTAFLPWPQAIRAECLARAGQLDEARADAEESFALGCELGDPCWEGMAARALALVAWREGDIEAARRWIRDARRRSDRYTDHYVWVCAYVGLTELELAATADPARVPAVAGRLYEDALRADLPEFQAWALLYRATAGDTALAAQTAHNVDNPALQARIAELVGANTSAERTAVDHSNG